MTSFLPTAITRRGAVAAALLLATGLAAAQGDDKARVAQLKPKGFPSEPIEVNVVYPAGGGMDLNARLVAKYFEKWAGEKTVVMNRVGGAGLVGHTYLASQAPNDGHTVGVVANLIFGDSMLRSQNRWSYKNLEPIAFLNSEGLNLMVSSDGPYKDRSLKELVELAKQKPGTIRVGILPGTAYEYMFEQIEQVTGAKFLKVPFQGGAPAVTALLGGNIDLAAAYYGELRSFLDAKKVSVLANSAGERSPLMTQVPTLNEALGRQDVIWATTRWVAVPKGVSPERRQYLAAGFSAAARDPELQAEFRKLGTTVGQNFPRTEDLAAYLNKLADLEHDFYVKSGRLK